MRCERFLGVASTVMRRRRRRRVLRRATSSAASARRASPPARAARSSTRVVVDRAASLPGRAPGRRARGEQRAESASLERLELEDRQRERSARVDLEERVLGGGADER